MGSACLADHTLYYLDTTRNVCRVQVHSDGHPVGKSARLTALGGYDDFSVSPDGKQVVGIKNAAKSNDEFYEGKFSLEIQGKRPIRNLFHKSVTSDGAPSAWWSPKMNYLMACGGQIGGTTYVYSIKTGRDIYMTPNEEEFGPISVDERYSLLQEFTPPEDGPVDQWVLDMQSGKTTRVMKIWSGDGEDSVWIGGTHRFAVIGSDKNIWIESVVSSGKKPSVTKYALTHGGGYADLRCLPGRGLYFAQRARNGKLTGYYSNDLRTVQAGKALHVAGMNNGYSPDLNLPKNAVDDQASVTDDGRLIACPVVEGHGSKATSQIRVFTKSGVSFPVAIGRKPHWKDSK